VSQGIQAIEPNAADSSETSPFVNPWRVVVRRKWIIVLGAVLGLAAGSSYLLLTGPDYESTAEVLVIKKHLDNFSPTTGESSGQGPAEDYLATHQAVIVSSRIVDEAIEKNNLRDLKCFQDKEDMTNRLIRALSVSRGSRKAGGGYANVLTLGFRSKVPDDCRSVVQAIIAQYQDFLRDTYKNVNNQTLELITKAKNVLNQEIAKKQKELDGFRQKSPEREGSAIHQERLTTIDAKRSATRLRRTEIEATLTAIDRAVKNGRNLADFADMLSVTPGGHEQADAGPNERGTHEQELLKLQLEEKSLSRYFEQNHPEMQTLRKKMDVVRAAMAPSAGNKSQERQAMDEDIVRRRIQRLKQDVETSKATEEGLNEEFQREQEKAKIALEYEAKEDALRKSIEQYQRLYEIVLKRLDDINIIQDYGGYDTQIITPPERGKMVKTAILLIVATALSIGLLVGFGVAWLVDITDKSFRTPEEIRQQLTCPVLGYIPRFRPNADSARKAQLNGKAPDASLCTYYQSTAPEAEAYRSVRTALFFNAHSQGYKVVQVTSPKKGDGKTTLAANLAFSIAQSGKKILLIDADLRNPCVGKVFPVSSTSGLTSVLSGEADLASVIQPSVLPELSILPCGPLPSNPAELLTSPRLQELLDSLRQQYDFVLVDTPPLLTVTDPTVVAARVDGVILTIRLSLTGAPHAQQSREILTSLKAKLLGVVINGVSNRSDSYGYGGSYGYGAGQR